MNRRHSHIMLWIVLCAILAFCLIVLYGKTQYRYDKANYKEIYSDNAVWDLSEVDFETTIVKLSGNVEHIKNEILTPKEFENNKEKIEIGSPTDTNEGRTARMTLIMPENKSYHIYTIGDYARKLYLNGEERGKTGEPSNNAQTFVPAYGAIFGDVDASNNKIEIVIQGGNFVHVTANAYTNVYVGNTELVQWFMGYENSLEFSVVAVLIFLTALHLIFALMYGNYQLHLTFSVSCIVWAVRLGLVGSKILYEIIPDLPWEVAFKTEYMTIPIGCILIIEIIYLQLKDVLNIKALRIFEVIFVIFAIVFLFVDTYTMSMLRVPLQITYILPLLYLTFSGGIWLVKQHRKKQSGGIIAQITFLSIFIIFYAGISDALYFNKIYLFGITVSLSEVSILIFCIYQTVATFYITVQNMQQARIAEKEALAIAQTLKGLNKMKTVFLQNMSHEMKTPLTVIGTGLNYAIRLINKPTIDTKDTAETLSTIKEQSDRLSRMISSMVDMTEMVVGEHRKN